MIVIVMKMSKCKTLFDIPNKKRKTGVDFIYSIILKLAAHIIVNIMNKLTTERVDRASLA